MIYSDVLSLKHTIQDLLNSSDISFREILEFAYKEVESSEKLAKRALQRSPLDKIRVKAWKLKEVIRSHVSYQIDSHFEESNGSDSAGWKGRRSTDTSYFRDNKLILPKSSHRRENLADGIQLSIEQQDLKQEIHSFTETLKKLEEKYVEGLYYSWPKEEEEEDDDDVLPTIDFGRKKSKIVGLSDMYNELKKKLITVKRATIELQVHSLVGMPSIGKTTIAKEIFEDPKVVEHFNCRPWVTVGRKHQLKEILRHILSQLNPDISDQMLAELGDEDIARYMSESLKGNRYLIVLDDVGDRYMRYDLQLSYRYETNKLKNAFPDEQNGSRVLLTTRLEQVDEYGFQFPNQKLTMRLLNKEESWDLLRKKVFAGESCPSQLEKAGKKIAQHCDGLPLTIITVADLLSKAEMTSKYWSNVAA